MPTRTLLRSRVRREGEDGFALLTTLLVMAVLIGLFVPDYMLTCLMAMVRRRPSYLVYGLFFFPVRIIDACDRLGFDTVLGVSSADRDTLAARRAGRTVVIGGPRSAESYLATDTVLQAAIEAGLAPL